MLYHCSLKPAVFFRERTEKAEENGKMHAFPFPPVLFGSSWLARLIPLCLGAYHAVPTRVFELSIFGFSRNLDPRNIRYTTVTEMYAQMFTTIYM